MDKAGKHEEAATNRRGWKEGKEEGRGSFSHQQVSLIARWEREVTARQVEQARRAPQRYSPEDRSGQVCVYGLLCSYFWLSTYFQKERLSDKIWWDTIKTESFSSSIVCMTFLPLWSPESSYIWGCNLQSTNTGLQSNAAFAEEFDQRCNLKWVFNGLVVFLYPGIVQPSL